MLFIIEINQDTQRPRRETSLARQLPIVKCGTRILRVIDGRDARATFQINNSKPFTHLTITKQPRDQLRPSLDAKLDENIPQMKLDCLFADLQPGSDRGIR
jgi:hypothetical protein